MTAYLAKCSRIGMKDAGNLGSECALVYLVLGKDGYQTV